MQLITVRDSDVFTGIGFHLVDTAKKQGTLVLRFHSGDIWMYPNIPAQTWAEFVTAQSRGRFYTENIKGNYYGIKTTPADVAAIGSTPVAKAETNEPTALVTKKLLKLQRKLKAALEEVEELMDLFGIEEEED